MLQGQPQATTTSATHSMVSDQLRQQKQADRQALLSKMAAIDRSAPIDRTAVAAPKQASEHIKKAGSETAKEQTPSLRSLIKQAREDKKQGAGGMAKAAVASSIKTFTSELLQQYWDNAIETFGASLLLINVHVFCRYVFGEEYFCKLGHEWIPKSGKGGPMESVPLFGIAEGGLGLLEAGFIIILDMFLLAIILLVMTTIGITLYIIVHPIKTLWAATDSFGDFFTLIVGAFNLIVLD